MSWTQPCCEDCWIKRNAAKKPVRVTEARFLGVTCCFCGRQTHSGIYVQVDPATVAYPAKGEVKLTHVQEDQHP